MLVLTLIIGLLYALPNLYGEDPAIQITGARGNVTSESMLVQIRTILEQQHIASKSIILDKDAILVRLPNFDVQLRAHEALINALNQDYVIALSLAMATPPWLASLGATPMKLGLDLRGGIHFLVEVDTEAALNKLQEQTMESLSDVLCEQGIPYTTVRKSENYSGGIIYFRDGNTRDQAIVWLTTQQRHHDLVISSIGNNALRATLADDRLRQVRKYAVEKNITILRNRINQLGIIEPVVQRQGADRIVVELPGILDTARAKEILGATATLEFRLVNDSVATPITTELFDRIPEDSEVKITRDGQKIILYKRVILTGDHIIHSTYNTDAYNRPQVNIYLDGSGGTIMSKFTKNNIGKLMATLFVEYKNINNRTANGKAMLEQHDEIINIATIQSRLGNSFRITGMNNPNEARQLSLLLRAGALIAPIQIVEERTIGPMLGLHNINQGLEACWWGLVASIVFMVVWYRKFGMIATMALIANLVLMIGSLSLLPGATLTMPGIAGIVLTLAVAVDANVLINERIKEELRNGCMVQQAIHKGYRGAFSSIVDANITTLITACILYVMGTGSIKGFAITTAIGIVTSMFTAIIGTRAMVNFFYGNKQIDKLSI